MEKEIQLFLKRAKKHRRVFAEWIELNSLGRMYCRRAVRSFQEGYVTTFDIATVEIYEKGQGTFTKVIEIVERLNPWDGVYVESIMETRLHKFLEKRGYILVQSIGPPYSRVKLNDHLLCWSASGVSGKESNRS
jgi:hypothetical protein